MQAAAEQLGRLVVQQAALGAEDFQVAAILVEHQEQVGNGLGDGAQPCLAEAQRLFDPIPLQQIVEQHAEGGGGQRKDQQRRQGDFPHRLRAQRAWQQQGDQAEHAQVQKHAEPEQLPEGDADQPPARSAAVGQAERDGQQYIGQPRHHAGPAHPQAKTTRQRARYARHQWSAEQPGHAQYRGTCIEDDAGLADAGVEHAENAGAAEPEAGEQFRGALSAAVPAAGGKGQQPAQREQHDRVFYDGIEGQDSILGQECPLQDCGK